VKLIADAGVLDELVRRLQVLAPMTSRRWGTLSAHEMLCHLADATASVLSRPGDAASDRRLVRKWVALFTPLPWPHDLKTPPHVDPRLGGTQPGVFEHDRERAIEGLRALAGAAASALPGAHGHFGAMRHRDWQRWGYRHTDHHLRQFGL
jgi:hypothetical protein